MPVRHHSFHISTSGHHEVLDLTGQVADIVRESGVNNGVCTVFVPHATCAIALNENDDPNIGVDLQNALAKMVIEHDGWLHDRVDNNAAAHIKAAIMGPSESIPIVDGKLELGTWQNVFLCEFDGPRSDRRVMVTVAD